MNYLRSIKVSLVIFIAMAINQVPLSTGWRGIVPLKSTRADVERILGPPTDKSGISYFSDGSVVVQYSVRPCDSGWNVPPETVIALGIRAEPMIPLADLHLDLTKYKKVRGDADVSDHFYYADEERGFAISVRDGMVNRYVYEPTANDESHRCRKVNEMGEPTYQLDIYGDLNPRDEEIRLDNFAIALGQRPKAKGHIFIYSGKNMASSVARARARRAKNYLVRVRGINPNRLVALYGGARSDFTVQLYIVPPGAKRPSPFAPP